MNKRQQYENFSYQLKEHGGKPHGYHLVNGDRWVWIVAVWPATEESIAKINAVIELSQTGSRAPLGVLTVIRENGETLYGLAGMADYGVAERPET